MFDHIVVVDWSANSTPKRGADSIWIAQVEVASGATSLLENARTRADARDLLAELLARPGRTLAGFDFPFGYPAGFAAAAALGDGPPWRAVWRHLAATITDDARNRNNRWDVAADLNRRIGQGWFWGAPHQRSIPDLTTRKPMVHGSPVAFREVERRLREVHRRNPSSCRQLLGAGSVGSQALTGIPVLDHLCHLTSLVERVRVWPFEALDPASPDHIVLAEVWPSFLPAALIADVDHSVKDAQQVIALAQHLAEHDRIGGLDALLDRATEPHLDAETAATVRREEGWVLLV